MDAPARTRAALVAAACTIALAAAPLEAAQGAVAASAGTRAAAALAARDAGLLGPCRRAVAAGRTLVACGGGLGAVSATGPSAARRAGARGRLRLPPLRRGGQLVLVVAAPARLHYVRFALPPSATPRAVTVSSAPAGRRLVARARLARRTLRPVLWRSAAVAPARPAAVRAPAAPAGAPAPPAAPAGPAEDPPPPDRGGPAWVPPPLAGCSQLAPGAGQPDAALDQRWTPAGPGWAGGDATYSVALPDGRTVWIFGDTFIGAVSPDRQRGPGTAMVRNAAVVEDRGALRTLVSGTPGHPESLVNADAGSWFWPGDGVVEGQELRLFMTRFRPTGTGEWDFGAAETVVASFALPDLRFQGIRRVADAAPVTWGAATLETADGTYVYGVEDAHPGGFAHVARAPNGVQGPWEYWTGNGWSARAEDSARIAAGVSNQFSVIAAAGRFVLVNQAPVFGRQIAVAPAADPWGPFDARTTVFTAPSPGPGRYAYNATAHPEASSGGRLLVSYNTNSFDPATVRSDADSYRPRFVQVPLCGSG